MTAENTSISPDAPRLWRTVRLPVAIALLIVGVSVAGVLARGSSEGGTLDPRSVVPSGSRALARLLEAEGVHVQPASTAAVARQAVNAAGADATLLVTRPDWLLPPQLQALRGSARDVVLVTPGPESLTALAPSVRASGDTDVRERTPACSLDAARVAGVADMGGLLYRAPEPAQLCYATGGEAPLVSLMTEGRTTTILGTAAPLTNHKLDENGNAALAMRLLGRHRDLIWYVPSLGDPSLSGAQKSFYDLLPSGWKFGLAQVALAVLLLALWRARRLGPVVAEPLPVVVRAAETVEGRARLYRRAGARDRAAAALRSAAHARLVTLLGLPPDADPHAVVDAAARRSGRPAATVGPLMYGAPPPDDAALVRLADDLDALEKEVRRT